MRALAIAAAVVMVISPMGSAADLQTHPPTDTLNGSTAHTLHRGEVRVGSVNFDVDWPNPGVPFDASQLKWLNVEYGLTDRLQIGTTVLENVLEGPNAWAKVTALRTRTWRLAMPLTVDVGVEPLATSVGSGVSLSWAPTRAASLHGSVRFWAFDGQVQLSRIAAALEYELFSTTHLFAEANAWPLAVEIGSLSRVGPLNAELSSRIVDAAAPNLDLELELFVRF